MDRGPFTPDDISDWFWDLIEKAGRSRQRLEAMLREMSREEIVRFDNEFQEAAVQLVDEPFFPFMDEGISEDGAKDIADWVVSQGKTYYSDVWANPHRIPRIIGSGTKTTLTGVAENVFWDRFNSSIPTPY